LCRLYSCKGEHEKALVEGERAVALTPSGWDVLTHYGTTLTFAGKPEEAIPLLEKVIRLNPFGPATMYANLGGALRAAERYEEAVSAFKKTTQLAPDNFHYRVRLAVTCSLMGREREARTEAAEVLRINPKFSVDELAMMSPPFKDPSEMDKIVNALHKAGLK
jgi:tetratricopeptide (TPR) repeat protein